MADYIRPVVFRLGDQEFGVDINLVQSIEKQVNVVPVCLLYTSDAADD